MSTSSHIPDDVRAKGLARGGWLAYKLGDTAHALPLLRESLKVWRRVGDAVGIGQTLSNLGGVLRVHDYREATEVLEEALALRRQFGSAIALCTTLLNLGITEAEQGHNERA